MRHGGGADFARHRLLFEIPQRDVAPDIARKVDQDDIVTGDGVKQLGDIIVGFDLNGVAVPFESQSGDETPGEFRPVDIRVGDHVGVVVADGAVDLAQQCNGGNLFALAPQAMHDVRQLLAERRR